MTFAGLFAFIVGYYICLHGIYLLLIVLGLLNLRRYQEGIVFGDFERIAASRQTLPFSVIVPAYNEACVIAETVAGALGLRYPQYEVIVVNDGSSDATLDILIERFQMRVVHKVVPRRLPTAAIRAVYESEAYPNLIVIDKENGRRADAINAGVNVARYPMLCMMDADCVLEEDALVRAVRPFLLDKRVVAAGGIVRPANGLRVQNGRIVGHGIPKRALALFQTVEYLRSFQWARLGLATMKCMLCISGAFMVVRRSVVLEMGGFNPKAITDDMDFTIALHEYVHRPGRQEKLRIEYIPDPVCYTEVPETVRLHAAQRNRWQRGTLQALLRHWRMLFNPRYGSAGLFGAPYFLIFEGFSAVVELLGYLLVPLMYFMGVASPGQLLLYFVLAIVLTTFQSVSAVLLHENTRFRVERTRDVLRLLAAGFLENFGYHQLHLLWRVGGTFDYLVRHRTDLGLMQRHGSHQAAAAPP